MGATVRENVEELDSRRFGSLKYFGNPYVRDALQELPEGYVFDHDNLPPFKKKGHLTGADIAQYVKDHYDDWDAVPPSNAFSQMLGAMSDVTVVEQDGRHRNTRKYDVQRFTRDHEEELLSAINKRLEPKQSYRERAVKLLSSRFNDPFTYEEAEETIDEELGVSITDVLPSLVLKDELERSANGYSVPSQ